MSLFLLKIQFKYEFVDSVMNYCNKYFELIFIVI